MTTQNTVARIAGISVPVIIGVGLVAAGAPFVVGTLWVLLVGLALLVTWWLVLNLLGGVAEKTVVPIARILALVIIGVTLLAAGISFVLTLWISSFARFMYLEDLGLAEGTTAAAMTDFTPVDRGLLLFGGILAVLGATAVIAAAVQARNRWHVGR